MAENGFVEGVLGGGEASGVEGEAVAAEVRPALDPIAASLAVHATKAGKPLDRSLKAYLETQERLAEKQARLVEVQVEHMHRQGEVQLSSLKLRRSLDQIKLGLQLFFVLVVTVLGFGAALMLYDAFTSNAVVVSAFKAPSTLAARGLTGDVVAADVLDALQKMQHATHAIEKSADVRGAWASDIKIEVPETGVSIGEINRLLHERFGHDLHIDGDLIETEAGGWAITVRGDGVPGATFTSEAKDLEKLTQQAAEYIYGRSQPERFAAYLENANRFADAAAFIQDAYPRATSDAERAQLANSWGNAYVDQGQTALAAEKYHLSMSLLKPRTKGWWKAWVNIVGTTEASQGEEAGWREGHAFLQAAAAAPRDEKPELRIEYNAAQLTWDFPLTLASVQTEAILNGGAGAAANAAGPSMADIYGLMHDPAQAQRYLASSDPSDPATKAEGLLLPGYAAIDRGDWAGAAKPLDAFYTAWQADPNIRYSYTNNLCFTGLADGMTGRVKDAEAIFARLPRESLCAALHGEVLAHAGDVAGAERVWADGLKSFPDLPAVPLYRGLYELSAGDLKAAEADLSAAAAKAPHWAEPWKAWGDLLAREGRWRDAVAKYDEARKYAPAWSALKEARDAAAQRAG